MPAVELVHAAGAELGEGPAWDAKSATLYWVDILERRVHAYRGGAHASLQLGATPGCLAPCRDGRLALAARDADGACHFSLLDPENGRLEPLAAAPEPAGNRFNDGKCDPRGRFLAGTMDVGEQAASGSLYSFDGARVTRLLEGLRISNGLAWSPEGTTLYHIDTPARQVTAYTYDLESGRIADPRVVVRVPPELGWPDGMASDTAGNLWVALWGGAAVTRWDPQGGALLERLPVPARNVTSVVFGGRDLDELFITSARAGLAPGEPAGEHAGGLFCARPGVEGVPTFEFG